MRVGSIVLALAFLITPACAEPKPPDYYLAENVFASEYDLRERVTAQAMLIAAGQQTIVPTENLQMKTFDGTRAFQAANGLPANGAIDRTTFDRLSASTRPLFQMWEFREVGHPSRGRPIWMPTGMGLSQRTTRNGLTFKEPGDRFQVSYNYYPRLAPERGYAWLLDKMRDSGTVVHYSAIKNGWFVISATTATGFDEYLRYHEDGDGILGFTSLWNNEKGIVYGERIAILMSASLGSVMNGRPFVEPPRFGYDSAPRVAQAAPVKPPRQRPIVVTVPATEQPMAWQRRKPPEEPAQSAANAASRPPVALPPGGTAYAELAAPPKLAGPPLAPPPPPVVVESTPSGPSLSAPAVLAPSGEKRVALVIGNSAYRYAPEIPNPAHDAQDAAEALRNLGFEVVEGRDLDYQSIRAAVREFSEKIAGADLTLFYYAGHGVQVSGKNYIIPIDAQLVSAGNLDIDAINIESVLRAMETEPRTNIVILDACRDNPFTRSLRRSITASRTLDVGTGLAPIDTHGGTLVAFATDPGNVALDGNGSRNSPFTEALLKHIKTPALEVETLLKRVRRDVVEATRGKQTPWSSSSLTREIFLARAVN